MPNIKSAKKRLLQTEKRRLLNRSKLMATRNAVKRLRKTTNAVQAAEMLPKVTSMLDKLSKKNIIHDNTAANYKSKLTKFVNKLNGKKAKPNPKKQARSENRRKPVLAQ